MKPSVRLAKYLNFAMEQENWERSYIHPFLCLVECSLEGNNEAVLPAHTIENKAEYLELVELLHPQMHVDEGYSGGCAWFSGDDEHRVMAGAFLFVLLEEAGL